jgi:glucokinase
LEVLAGDIGGTKALLAIVDIDLGRDGGPLKARVGPSRRYESREHPGLESVCRAFEAETGRPLPRRAGFGVAGPVVGGRVVATNLPWVMDEEALRQQLAAERVRLINDFAALGLGLVFVERKDLVPLNEGIRDARGPVAVLGAGTGLGECVVVTCEDGSRRVLPSEGGHCDFAPRDGAEIAVLTFLARRHDHVSWERVLSGEGLVNLAEAIADHDRLPLAEPLVQQLASHRYDAPSLVTHLARQGDAVCRRALETFCRLYGAEAGNLALKALSTGGVYVAGGIAPRIVAELSDGRFRAAFLDKGRMRPVLTQIPVHVVLDPLTPLYGAAAVAAQA